MKMSTSLKPELLVSKNEQQAALHDPYLDTAKKKLYVTNGHAIAVMDVEIEEDDVDGCIPIEAIKLARSNAKKKKLFVAELACTDDEVILADTTRFNRVAREFPHRAVVDLLRDAGKKQGSPPPGVYVLNVDATLLRKPGMCSGYSGGVTVVARSPSEPIIVTTVHDGSLLGLVMPISVGENVGRRERLPGIVPLRGEAEDAQTEEPSKKTKGKTK